MVGTILPIVYGERQQGKQPVALRLHTIGYLLGAAGIGGLLGTLGAALPWQASHTSRGFVVLIVTGFVSLLYSAHELSLFRVPAPQCRWQVSAAWRSQLPSSLAALSYGLGLGFGLATRIPVSTYYPAAIWAVLVGNPVLGALGMAMFGLGRAIPLLFMAWLLDTNEEGFRLAEALQHWKPLVHFVNGLALGFAGPCLIVTGFVLY